MIKETSDGCIIAIKVLPKAKKNEIVGWEGEELKIRLAAVPEKGAANEELIRFLAKAWGLSRRQIQLISGATSRHKRLLVDISINNFKILVDY